MTVNTSEQIDHDRRRLFGVAALSVAAAELGLTGVPSAEFRRQQLPTRTVVRLTTAFLFQSGVTRPQTKRTSPGPVKCTPFFGPLGWVVCT
jgi:hypothetical protein